MSPTSSAVSARETTATNGSEIWPSLVTSGSPAVRNRMARTIWVGNPEQTAISPIAASLRRAGGRGSTALQGLGVLPRNQRHRRALASWVS